MKSTPSELIFTFRKKILLTSVLGIILSVLGMVLLFFLKLPGILRDDTSLFAGLFIAVIFYFWERNYTYRKILTGLPEDVMQKLESHINQENLRSQKRKWPRIFVLTAVALAWIILLIVNPDSSWTTLLFLFWIAAILFVFLTRWLRMKEEFMMQDLKHYMREDHSELS